MYQLYIALISLVLLILIFSVQNLRLKKIENIKVIMAEKIRLKGRAQKIADSKKYLQTRKEQNKENKSGKKYNEHLSEIQTLLRHAEVDLARGKFDSAEQMLIQLLAFDAKHITGHERLALLYLKTERPHKAELVYNELLSNNAKNDANWANLGLAYYQQGKYRQAISSYEKSIRIDSKKASRYAALGQIYLITRRSEKALENFEKALRRDRKNIDFLFLKVEGLKQVGDYIQTKEILEKILNIQPYNQSAKEELRKLIEQHALHEPEIN